MLNIKYSPEIAQKIREEEPIEDVAMREAPPYLEAHKISSGVAMKNPKNPKNNKNAATASNARGCYSRWGDSEAIGKDVIFMISDFRNCSYLEAYSYQCDYYGFTPVENKDFTKRINENIEKINKYNNNIFDEANKKALDYFHDRGITDTTIKNFKLGYCPARGYEGITIPYFDQSGQPIYYAKRCFNAITGATSIEGRPKYTKALLYNSAIEQAKVRVKEAEANGVRPNNSDIKLANATPSDYSENIIWGYHTLNTADSDKKNILIIAEGAFDALSFAQEGYPTISAITCNFNNRQLDEVFRICKQFDNVYLTLDNDSSGQYGNHKLAKEFIERGINFNVAILPQRKNYQELIASGLDERNPDDLKKLYYKDVSEYYQDYNEVKGILDNSMKGLIYQARLHTGSENEIRKFLLDTYRKVNNYEILEVIDYLEEHAKKLQFSETFIKDLRNLVKHAPPENIVAREVESEKELLFMNKSFYEYTNNQWGEIEDEIIEKYVGEKLGRFKKANYCKNIKNLIASDTVVKNIEFNNENVLVFQDGTLELETLRFRPSRKEDYNTFKLDYSYNPNEEIDCPIFDKFLEDITDGNEDKKNVLLEFGGYGFFPDQRFKKFLYLIGNGDNGKSVYTDIIADVFGSTGGNDGRGNIGKVDYSEFGKDFERIHLKGKLYNFSSEITRKTKGSEPILKAITGGDYITGANKHKNSVSFKCKAKLIFTGNDLPITQDKVRAYFNRFIIVNLPISFVPNPTKENEKLADLNLTNKLKKERSSIIKKFIQASKRLKENGGFTKIKESEELLEEYREISTPVLQFLNDLLENTALFLVSDGSESLPDFEEIPYTEFYLRDEDREAGKDKIFIKGDILFKYYKEYCYRNNITAQNRGNFSKEFRKHIEEKSLGKKTNNHNEGRGFVLYKDKIAELTGYTLDKEYNFYSNEDEMKQIKQLRQKFKDKMKQEGFELIVTATD